MRSFWICFKYRTVMCLTVICMLLLLCIVRLIGICADARTTAGISNTVTVELDSARGNIFDCKGKKITSAKTVYAVVFLPCTQGIMKFTELATDSERDAGLQKLRNKKPAVLRRNKKVLGVGVYCFAVNERYGQLHGLEHIIGYVNTEHHGVAGLEKSYDTLLYASAMRAAAFYTDTRGNYLLGTEPEILNDAAGNALYLTVDLDIQNIVAQAAASLQKGAVVVTETATGKIRAMLSKPALDIGNIAAYLNRSDAPMINRALAAFCVGSVFKPLVASALVENGQNNFSHRCTGFCVIGGIRFYCNNHAGHGDMTLRLALAKSCNTYFYNAAAAVPSKMLCNLASGFGFGTSLTIAQGIRSAAGNITGARLLAESKASVANFAIGQGDVTVSPLAMCNMYSAIANDGVYYAPTLIDGVFEGGSYKPQAAGSKNVVIGKATAAVVKEGLTDVLNIGTGKAARPETCNAAGKTATAQTGRFVGEKEQINSWFCGFFPLEQPKYTVVVFEEDARAGGSACAPIFKKIADAVNTLKQ